MITGVIHYFGLYKEVFGAERLLIVSQKCLLLSLPFTGLLGDRETLVLSLFTEVYIEEVQ
jgi:hypothetical protein